MKRTVFTVIIASGLAVSAGAQQAFDQPATRAIIERSQAGGARMAVETRVTRDAPYTADAVTEFVQTLADGNRIVRRTSTRLYRDSEGRTRREMINEAGEITEIVIADPIAGTNYVLNPASRTARKNGVAFAWTGAAGGRGRGGTYTVVVPGGGAAASPDDRTQVVIRQKIEEAATALRVERDKVSAGLPKREDLGDQTIEGVVARGSRSTTVVPAGAVGNEQPLTTTSEQWFSNELQVLVLTKHSDPRVGETTYRLTNIRRGEPDRSLFQLPSDYTVR